MNQGRFIPTPVGNTPRRLDIDAFSTVHPHARGEHKTYCHGHSLAAGSSPRPWGTLVTHHKGCILLRFIPTPVGNTSRTLRPQCGHSVHPHARGEHCNLFCHAALQGGSSPRPWGTPDELLAFFPALRFIPTPVGNTVGPAAQVRVGAVHPHARGEHFCGQPGQEGGDGSSPRPWGTPPRGRPCTRTGRFIPTPVGNTVCVIVDCGAWPVHPHARGEHLFSPGAPFTPRGSSPRPWGTPATMDV